MFRKCDKKTALEKDVAEGDMWIGYSSGSSCSSNYANHNQILLV